MLGQRVPARSLSFIMEGFFMGFEPVYKKPADLIRSEEWNKILDELVDLRKTIATTTHSVTLTSLESPFGLSAKLKSEMPEEFNYGMDVLGLITRQYFRADKGSGICRFGIHDYADILYYWAGASPNGAEALRMTLEYNDGTTFVTENQFIHQLSQLKPKGKKNPYTEYFTSPNQHIWYKYGLINPEPEKIIRHITFEDMTSASTIRIGNVIQYIARVRPLSDYQEKK
jgi:hypothetical protein